VQTYEHTPVNDQTDSHSLEVAPSSTWALLCPSAGHGWMAYLSNKKCNGNTCHNKQVILNNIVEGSQTALW